MEKGTGAKIPEVEDVVGKWKSGKKGKAEENLNRPLGGGRKVCDEYRMRL